jgi:predicted GH43/DUF377 family glycosyl hydrolase
MLERLETRCLLRPEDVPPSREDFEVIGVFNPGGVRLPDGSIVLLARVAERPTETREGFIASPRYNEAGAQIIDWIDRDQVKSHDPRGVQFHETGFKRLTFTSHLRVVYLSGDGMAVDRLGPTILPETDMEIFGLEDPRLTVIDGELYITVVGASWHGVNTLLMKSSIDFTEVERLGVVFMRENKDVILFPEKIGERFAAISRPTGKFETMQPEMWISYSPDLKHWGDHQPLWGSTPPPEIIKDNGTGEVTSGGWDDGRVGGGVPPIRTDCGWLKVYHASCKPAPGEPIGVYAAGALLLDHDDPGKVLAKTPDAFMRPEADFETSGFVKAVVFPTGYAIADDDLLLYYGAADTNIGVVRYRLVDLLDAMVPA